MPFYTVNLDPILEELDIPMIKSARIEVDRYIQEILGTIDADSETVWPLLHEKLQDPVWAEDFKKQLKAKWDARDWRKGLLS
ncbi:hypothetical protein ANRL1_02790 [Anaerolineae bacterium]|nr:hypothetical protein ANRL1_02790 [Anaerolineae bacterium]